ncbi:hypothetical protein KL918_000865 [Ogataea parapolymorpha]|uniref:Small ribosomal subunit protein mS29 n=1 Tax=Ogataea parapolymorpha (strain ATCC 26012 / BCRC 20466 / JCM 22074 / NRRL Y-7560 / DL-1) TaxID=871575 RepID=W1QC28_OGAPD|nr:37S ribosomal protein S23, mitochondrial [Ogataea parapolymorpha DL-1]ESW97257.1 37S ribosomal protein S23, mitochondrial [Ogataea parapolymorpha DL-1]KAG7869320.1 hypothetical protein KL918_000865 [Ogataea parapolymorpha]KAG7875628.1 hypothetical protein KL916_000299 [Ogataea parapolymorpha]
MFRPLGLTHLSQRRTFSSSTLQFAVYKSKSFSRKTKYDPSKNRKGPGKDKRFNKLIVSENYKKSATDQEVHEKLPVFSAENLHLDEVVKFKKTSYQKLHILGAFKPNQFNELYSRPITLSRKVETSQIHEFLTKSLSSSSKGNRLIITGDLGVGKSTMLTQFHALALEQDSVILQISNMDALVDGSNDFKYNSATGLYEQPMASRDLLKKWFSLNKNVFDKIKLSRPYSPAFDSVKKQKPIGFSEKNTLREVLGKLLYNPAVSRANLFQFLMDELAAQKGIPVFLTIDNFSALCHYANTRYRDKNNNPIYFQKFQLLKTLVEFISGDKTFQKGAIVAATKFDHKDTDTIPVALGLREPDYYAKFDQWDRKFTEQLVSNGKPEHMHVKRLSKEQVRALVEHMLECKVIPHEIEKRGFSREDDIHEVLPRLSEMEYLLSGNGNPRELYKNCVFSYI